MKVNEADTTRISNQIPRMNRELFGVFGGRSTFHRHRADDEFQRVVSGPNVTVGVRDDGLGRPGWTSVSEPSDGCCVIWGEIVPPADPARSAADWLYDRVRARGAGAFDELNGSYVAVVDVGDTVYIVPDLLRSRECFYADVDGGRIFGTDAARVARCIDAPTLDGIGLNQLLYFGVVFQDRTLFEELYRVRFDSALHAGGHTPLDRIVYQPMSRSREAHAQDLGRRLVDAVNRRSGYPRPTGVLSSAGFDSRLILAAMPDLDISYTLGTPTTPEVITARQLADQYGVDHELLPVTGEYLKTTEDIVQYTNGIRESLHIHHRGHDDRIDVQTMYHGLLLDTVLRDIYLPGKRIEAFGHALPLPGLVSNPDPLVFMENRLGIYSDGGPLIGTHPAHGDLEESEFLRQTMTTVMDDCRTYADSIYNAMSVLGLKVTQALPFHTHLADQYYGSLVAADADLVEWHLTTPPQHRNDRTYQQALEHVDDRLLAHRPPDRPHRSYMLNQIEKFLRRHLPVIDSPGTPWPDRDGIYEARDLDHKLFPHTPDVHSLPPRVKLRINDALIWLELATGEAYRPEEILRLEDRRTPGQ